MRKRRLLLFLVVMTISVIAVCEYSLRKSRQPLHGLEQYNAQAATYHKHRESTRAEQEFSIDRELLVFLHIQKTGGSDFDRNIVKNLLIRKNNKWERACKFVYSKNASISIQGSDDHEQLLIENEPKASGITLSTTTRATIASTKKIKFKKFACPRDNPTENQDPNWYFSRQTFGWVCGLHADYSELRSCVGRFYPGLLDTRVHYFTILREPIKRYISEWQHVARGATWRRRSSNSSSNNSACLMRQFARCLSSFDWQNVTLEEFMACKYNLANNRQTRMLAAYDEEFNFCRQSNKSLDEFMSSSGEELLRRAKQTLDSLAYFALNEYQYLSERLFERSLGYGLFKFQKPSKQSNSTIAERIMKDKSYFTTVKLQQIRMLNRLDVELYDYALKIFLERVNRHKIT
jgi:hypothetical protein